MWCKMSLLCFQGESAGACGEKWLQNETIFSAVSSRFSDFLWKYSNTIIGTLYTLRVALPWKQLQSLAPWVVILNTSWLLEMGKMGQAWNLTLPSHLRDMGDVWVLVFVTEIMGSASFALQTQRDKPFKNEITKQLTTQLISIYSPLQKSNSSLIKGRRQTSVCTLTPVPWDAVIFHNNTACDWKSHVLHGVEMNENLTLGKLAMPLTRSTPHLRQVAVRLPGLLAQVHHVSAQRLRGNGNLSKMLVIVTEVYCQEHLGTAGGRERKARRPGRLDSKVK